LEKHKEKLNEKKVRVVNLVSFLIGFSQAVVIYVMSTYFKEASGTENVGLFYVAAYAIILFTLLNLHHLIKVLGRSRVFIFGLFLKLIANVLLVIVPVSPWSILIMIFYLVAIGIEWTSLDAILETFSKDKFSGRIRGAHLTIINLGFLFGPMLATSILEKFDFYGVFILVFAINALTFIVGLLGLSKVNETFGKRIKITGIIKEAAKNKNIAFIFYISFILEFFYALMVIYTPLYLLDLGFSWEQIGLILTIMLVPFVFLQYPIGVVADKKYGEKEFLIVGIIITGLETFTLCLLTTKTVWIWALMLFGTRIGAALIEILRDSYFYKKIDERDVELIALFRTAMPVGYIVATGLSALILGYFPGGIKIIFLVVALAVFSALYPAFRLKDTK